MDIPLQGKSLPPSQSLKSPATGQSEQLESRKLKKTQRSTSRLFATVQHLISYQQCDMVVSAAPIRMRSVRGVFLLHITLENCPKDKQNQSCTNPQTLLSFMQEVIDWRVKSNFLIHKSWVDLFFLYIINKIFYFIKLLHH